MCIDQSVVTTRPRNSYNDQVQPAHTCPGVAWTPFRKTTSLIVHIKGVCSSQNRDSMVTRWSGGPSSSPVTSSPLHGLHSPGSGDLRRTTPPAPCSLKPRRVRARAQSFGERRPTLDGGDLEVPVLCTEETHMEHEHGPLEDDFPLEPSGVQLPCRVSSRA